MPAAEDLDSSVDLEDWITYSLFERASGSIP